jgi:hypothetical protein
MKIAPLLLLFGITIIALSGLTYTRHSQKNTALAVHPNNATNPAGNKFMEKLEQKAMAARLYTARNGFNETICFLADMSLPSGQNRFFIYDLRKDSIQSAGLVAHGNCFEAWLEGRRYSNVVGSGCTSLGRYRIGNSYIGKFGYSYKLYGLDSTNDNAYERTVVLHSYTCVPDTTIPDEICQSNGCPMVSPAMLLRLKALINNTKKPVLLWLYD